MDFWSSPEKPNFRTYHTFYVWLGELVRRCQNIRQTVQHFWQSAVRLRDGNVRVRHHDFIFIANYLHGRSGPPERSTSAGAGFEKKTHVNDKIFFFY